VTAKVEPYVRTAIDQRKIFGFDVPIAVIIIIVQLSRLKYIVVLTGMEGPRAPLLGVVLLQNARDQKRAVLGSDLIGARLSTCRVMIRTRGAICRTGGQDLISGAETTSICAANPAAFESWEKDFLI